MKQSDHTVHVCKSYCSHQGLAQHCNIQLNMANNGCMMKSYTTRYKLWKRKCRQYVKKIKCL